MTFHTPIETFGDVRWQGACDAFNQWRGKCLHAFTDAEAAITDLLIHQPPERAKLPHLVGQRFEAARALVAPMGLLPDAGVAGALEAFGSHDPLRRMLCHGRAKISVDRGGRWVAIVRLASLKAGITDLLVEVYEKGPADRLAEQLAQDSRATANAIRRLRVSAPLTT